MDLRWTMAKLAGCFLPILLVLTGLVEHPGPPGVPCSSSEDVPAVQQDVFPISLAYRSRLFSSIEMPLLAPCSLAADSSGQEALLLDRAPGRPTSFGTDLVYILMSLRR